MTMMVRARLRIGVDVHRPSPQLLRADASLVDCGRAVHAGGGGGVGVEAVAGDHGDAFVFPDGLSVCKSDEGEDMAC